MKPFNEFAKCDKCGCVKIHSRFQAQDSKIDDNADQNKPDRIIRSCERCGFSWDEAPLSSREVRSVDEVKCISLVKSMKEVERDAIVNALRVAEGNRELAAKWLEIGSRTLYRKIKEYQIRGWNSGREFFKKGT